MIQLMILFKSVLFKIQPKQFAFQYMCGKVCVRVCVHVGSFGFYIQRGWVMLGEFFAAEKPLELAWSCPGSPVWFGLGQSVIVKSETSKSRLQPEPPPCSGATNQQQWLDLNSHLLDLMKNAL